MKGLLIALFFAGAAVAQVASPAFSTGERLPSTAGLKPEVPPVTASPSEGPNRLADLLPQPKGRATLIGGTIFKIDRVRDQLTLNLFGGGRTQVLFDARTHIYRDGVASSLKDLQTGARVYVDTLLAGVDIFAQSIRVRTQAAAGQGSGQVASYDPRTGSLILNDEMSPQQLKLHLSPTTVVSREGKAASAGDLLAGTLVSVTFLPNASGQIMARTISILAAPGNTFVFVGRVVQLDLHLGLMVVADPRDQKHYEISFDPLVTTVPGNLREGVTVETVTRFNGIRYMASAINVDSNSKP